MKGEIKMIIAIATTALMLAVSLTVCFKAGEKENIVQYRHKED